MGTFIINFNEITMQAMGKLTMELICDRVLAESESLLASTGLKIKNIAYELGFIDQSHFAAYFRKRKQTSPKSFRKEIQNALESKMIEQSKTLIPEGNS